ncbi:hypothetical protein ACFVW2_01685 [Streptomyces sp. NPDC058171]
MKRTSAARAEGWLLADASSDTQKPTPVLIKLDFRPKPKSELTEQSADHPQRQLAMLHHRRRRLDNVNLLSCGAAQGDRSVASHGAAA